MTSFCCIIYTSYTIKLWGNSIQDKIELQIGKWGNSLVIRLPKRVLDVLHLGIKDRFSCSIKDGRLILNPLQHKKQYTLEELLAQASDRVKEVEWGKPEGDEIW